VPSIVDHFVWKSESPGREGLGGDSVYSSGLTIPHEDLQTFRDAVDSGVVLWSYTVPARTKLTADTLGLVVSPGGAWGVPSQVGGLSQSFEHVGVASLLVGGVTVLERPLRMRGLPREVVTGSFNGGPNNSTLGLPTGPDQAFAYGDGVQLDEATVLKVSFTATEPIQITTGGNGGSLPTVVRALVVARLAGSSAPVFIHGSARVRGPTETMDVVSYTVPSGGLTVLGFTTWADGLYSPFAARWVTLTLNGDPIHEFFDLHVTAHTCSRMGDNVGGGNNLSIQLGGAEFFPTDKLALVGNPTCDTGGSIAVMLVGTTEPLHGDVFLMRAYNTVLAHDVTWEVFGTPDTTGAQSGYPLGNLTDVVVAHRSQV
jgi:hypothetical protein